MQIIQHRMVWAAMLAGAGASAFAQAAAGGTAVATASARRMALHTGPASAPPAAALKPCNTVTVDPTTYLALGKSRVVRLDFPAARLVVGGTPSSRASRPVAVDGNPAQGTPALPTSGATMNSPAVQGVADTEITLLSPTELFFLGRKTGSMNVVLQSSDGRCVVKDIVVTIDPETLQSKIGELMPEEGGVKVRAAENAVVLTGSVSDGVRLDQIVTLASMYGDGKKVVNLLRVNSPQQVMLEVKIAEVSKTLLNRFGLDYSRLVTSANGLTSSIISGIVGGGAGLLGQFRSGYNFGAIGGNASVTANGSSATGAASIGATDVNRQVNGDGSVTDHITYKPGAIGKSASLLGIDAKKSDGFVRLLAEPNIMAISGQSASFTSGGRFYIPVPQQGGINTLQEKSFGVILNVTPTVLDGSRMNLKLQAEVSDLSQTGAAFTTVSGQTAILPTVVTRNVDTTVQLQDGQSFMVAGLIKNNMSGSLDKFPGLGEVPVMGALFRSTDFQNDQTELMFVITPRLVKPTTGPITLPTDNHVPPSYGELFWNGNLEGPAPPPAPASATAAPAATRP